MLCINISVNAVAHCMLVKHADLYTRESLSEHMGVSSKTGNKLSVSQMSVVLTYHHLSKHTISDSDFTILTSGNSKFYLEMRESLLISKLKPILVVIERRLTEISTQGACFCHAAWTPRGIVALIFVFPTPRRSRTPPPPCVVDSARDT